VSWNVNEVATTNVTLTLVAPLGTQWARDPNNNPFEGCISTGTPVSSISADGRTLVCNVGDHDQGSNGEIRPILTLDPPSGVSQLLDGDLVPMQATADSDGSSPAISNATQTIVSGTTSWNWTKGAPETVLNVTRGGVPGRVLVYPLALQPNAASKIGSEPVDDTVAIEFWDHAVDLTPSAVLADGTSLSTRAVCGGYDGVGDLPYGKVGLGDATNTTSGALAGTEVVTCTDATAAAATGYPVTKITITGHNTFVRPPKSAHGNGTNIGVSVQIAFWMPESELLAKADPSDGVIGNGTGSAALLNAISGSTAEVLAPAYGVPATVAPVLVASAGGALDESETAKNTNWSGVSFGAPAGGGGGAAGTTSLTRV
jgi:hypothetical protein